MRGRGRVSAVIAALTLGLAATACGGGEDTSGVARLDGGTTTSGIAQTGRDFQDAALDYAECMRENGVDMPDPEGGGFVITPDSGANVDRDEFEKADSACRKHLDGVKPPELSEEDRREFEQAALEHARCMREHGVEVPDPQATDGGGFALSLDGIDLDDPKFKAAQRACESKLRDVGPGGGS